MTDKPGAGGGRLPVDLYQVTHVRDGGHIVRDRLPGKRGLAPRRAALMDSDAPFRQVAALVPERRQTWGARCGQY